MMALLDFSRTSTGRTFALGALAGVVLLGTGMMLGGAQRGRHNNARPDGSFDTLSAEKLEIVDRRGRVKLRLRGNHENGGLLQVFDRSGDLRVELLADGSVRTYGGNGNLRALLGRDPHGWGDRRAGVLELFDTYGNHVTRLPGSQHPSDCTCEVCSGTYRPWDDHDHNIHDGHDDYGGYHTDDDDHYDEHDDHYDRPRRPRRPGWRDEDDE